MTEQPELSPPFIGGRWTPSARELVPVHNPARGVVAQTPLGSKEEVDAAVKARQEGHNFQMVLTSCRSV